VPRRSCRPHFYWPQTRSAGQRLIPHLSGQLPWRGIFHFTGTLSGLSGAIRSAGSCLFGGICPVSTAFPAAKPVLPQNPALVTTLLGLTWGQLSRPHVIGTRDRLGETRLGIGSPPHSAFGFRKRTVFLAIDSDTRFIRLKAGHAIDRLFGLGRFCVLGPLSHGRSCDGQHRLGQFPRTGKRDSAHMRLGLNAVCRWRVIPAAEALTAQERSARRLRDFSNAIGIAALRKPPREMETGDRSDPEHAAPPPCAEREGCTGGLAPRSRRSGGDVAARRGHGLWQRCERSQLDACQTRWPRTAAERDTVLRMRRRSFDRTPMRWRSKSGSMQDQNDQIFRNWKEGYGLSRYSLWTDVPLCGRLNTEHHSSISPRGYSGQGVRDSFELFNAGK